MAGIVIDASSPAANITPLSTPVNTCAAFTPPADALFLVVWAGNSSTNSNPGPPTITSSPSQTWVMDGLDQQQSGSPSLPGQVAVFHAVVSGSPGSTTITITNQEHATSFTDSIMKVFVITGHDPVTPIGQVIADRMTGVTFISESYPATISGSDGFIVFSDWQGNDSSVWTPPSGCTIVAAGGTVGEVTYAVVQRTTADGILGVPTTLGMDSLVTSSQWHVLVVEAVSHDAVVAAATQAGYPAAGANAPMF